MKLKPFQLVRVIEDLPGTTIGQLRYIGQTVSFPTADETIVIRRVPNLASTARILPVTSVQSLILEPPQHYVHYATVAGSGPFPVDMLRYCGVVPVNFDIIEEGGLTVAKPYSSDKDYVLVIALINSTAHTPFFSEERWNSFNWSIRREATRLIVSGEE